VRCCGGGGVGLRHRLFLLGWPWRGRCGGGARRGGRARRAMAALLAEISALRSLHAARVRSVMVWTASFHASRSCARAPSVVSVRMLSPSVAPGRSSVSGHPPWWARVLRSVSRSLGRVVSVAALLDFDRWAGRRRK